MIARNKQALHVGIASETAGLSRKYRGTAPKGDPYRALLRGWAFRPNQQGQDDMPRVMRFILDQQPADSQVIIATEHLFGLTSSDAEIINVGVRKNQLLSDENFEQVSDLIRPYLGQLL